MSEENKNSFIEKIEFAEDFPPFSSGDKIEFWWKKEVQDLMEFHLKDKENASRFKINCVLGNNWGWKSNLLEAIYSSKENNWDISISGFLNAWKKILKIQCNSCIDYCDCLDKTITILDDFFILSKNKDWSIHKNLFNWRWYEKFLISSNNFLLRNKTINEIFSYFLKEKLNESWFLDFNLELRFWYTKYNILPELLEKLNKLSWDWINKDKFENFCSTILYLKWFWWTITTPDLFYPNIIELLKKDNEFFYVFLSFSGILSDILKLLLHKWSSKIVIQADGSISWFWFYHYISILEKAWIEKNWTDEKSKLLNRIITLFETLKNDIQNVNGLNLNEYVKWSWSAIFKTTIPTLFKEIYEETKNTYITSFEWIKFTEQEIEFLWENFPIDLKLKNKDFSDLSSWEKLILARFTNIYEYVEKYKYWEKFTILIDEPDLHLHLEWQRKYIQKLVDVFSTLPKEIKLHFIIATHSPFIISDLPKESLVLLENWKQKKYKKETFWANFIDLIRDWFFFENENLMWSFAENIIWDIAEAKRQEITNDNENENKELITNIENNIWDKFLRDNLLYFKKRKNETN